MAHFVLNFPPVCNVERSDNWLLCMRLVGWKGLGLRETRNKSQDQRRCAFVIDHFIAGRLFCRRFLKLTIYEVAATRHELPVRPRRGARRLAERMRMLGNNSAGKQVQLRIVVETPSRALAEQPSAMLSNAAQNGASVSWSVIQSYILLSVFLYHRPLYPCYPLRSLLSHMPD